MASINISGGEGNGQMAQPDWRPNLDPSAKRDFLLTVESLDDLKDAPLLSNCIVQALRMADWKMRRSYPWLVNKSGYVINPAEVVADIFEKTLQGTLTWKPDKSTFRTFIYRSIAWELSDINARFLREQAKTAPLGGDRAAKNNGDPILDAIAQDIWEQMSNRLPLDLWQVIEMKVAGYTFQEMSNELKLPLGTVYYRYTSALKKLDDLFN